MRINKLKKVVFPLLFILTSCSVPYELREERKSWNFQNWKQEYKNRALCLCILRGYEDKKTETELIKSDRSFYNPLGIAIFDKSLEPIVKNEIEKIKQDSINSIGGYPSDLKPLYNKRAVLNHCISFYNSKRLDDLSKKEQRKWRKIKNILGEIHKEIPTY